MSGDTQKLKDSNLPLQNDQQDQSTCDCRNWPNEFEKKFQQGELGKVLNQVSGYLALLTSITNVVLLYADDEQYSIFYHNPNHWFEKVDLAVNFYFLVLYLLHLFFAQHKLQSIISMQSLIDLTIFIPILVLKYVVVLPTTPDYEYTTLAQGITISLVGASRYIRMYNFGLMLQHHYKLGQTDVDRQINIVIITLVLLVYISCGLVANLETQYISSVLTVEEISDKEVLKIRKFHISLYFVIVTLLTVGYGDYSPFTVYGKLVVLFLVIFTIVIIPKQTNELLSLMSLQSQYRRTAFESPEVRHIIVTGSVRLQALKDFCQELFHPDHGSFKTKVAIIQNEDPTPDIKQQILSKYEIYITYLAGDPLKDKDLKRGDTQKAEACILLTNKNCKSAQEEDHKNILTALAIKKYVYDINKDTKDDNKHNIKLCMQLIKPESKLLYYKSINLEATNDQLIIVEEIKMNLLAKSCFAPGLISMISNLFTSAGDNADEECSDWMREYGEGMGHEIYRIQISNDDYDFGEEEKKWTFKKIADVGYTYFQAVVFALELEVKKSQAKSIIRLNPSDYVLDDWDYFNYYLYIICENEEKAKMVQELKIKDEIYYKLTSRDRNKDRNDKKISSIPLNRTQIIGNQYKMGTKTFNNLIEEEKEDRFLSKSAGPIFDESQSPQTNRHKKKLLKADDLFKGKLSFLINKDNSKPVEVEEGEEIEEDYYKDYDLLPKGLNQIETTEEKDLMKLNNHIVVCGIHSSLHHFILPLRAKYLKNNQQDIVIITPIKEIPSDIWNSISRFPRIFMVTGNPLDRDVLMKAQIHRASKAVILGHDPTIKLKKQSENNDEMIDAQSIFIYKSIQLCNPQLQILIELGYSSNINFLLPKNQSKHEHTKSTLYAAGEVYIATIIDTITAQAFFNPHVVTILQQILVGKKLGFKKEKNKQYDEKYMEKLQKAEAKLQEEQSNLWQISVPEECVNKTYDKLFEFLNNKKYVALGLYRQPHSTDNSYPYVYTNPDEKTTVTQRDRVFILSKEQPKDYISFFPGEMALQHPNEEVKVKIDMQSNVTVKDYYGVKKQLQDLQKLNSENVKKEGNDLLEQNKLNIQESKNDQQNNQNDNQQNRLEGEKEQINSLEFMIKAVERLENKIEEVIGKVDSVKGTLGVQDKKIKDKINETKDKFFKDQFPSDD